MSKKSFFKTLLLTGILAGMSVNAQTVTEPFLKLTSTDLLVEEFSLTGAEVQIAGNTVSIAYAAEPAKNRSFEFDNVLSFEFELRTETAVNEVKTVSFRAYVDGADILHVEAPNPLRQVNVYTVNGVIVASEKTDSNRTQVNLSALPQGVYLVQVGANSLLIIK